MLVKSQVKYIQSLGQKKFRDQEGVFIAEGPKMVRELLKASNVQLLHLFALASFREEGEEKKRISPEREGIPFTEMAEDVPLGRREDIPFTKVTEGELERLSYLSTPNQVLAVFKKPVFPHPDPDQSVSLVLDGIQDPGNLGTILRSAEAFGAAGIFLTEGTVSPYNSKVLRGSAGSIFRLPFLQISSAELIPLLRARGVRLLATSPHQGTPLPRISWTLPLAIFIGNEGAGLSRELTRQMDETLAIPQASQVESLNAGVAASIVLYEAARAGQK